MRRKPPTAAQVLAALGQVTGRGRGRRSPLYLWFWRNHDELAVGFAQNAPAWQVLAQFLGDRGVLDIDGKLPTARAARDAWWRVRRDRQKAGLASELKKPLEPGTEPATVQAVMPPSPSLPSTLADPAGARLPPLSDDTRPKMPPIKLRGRQAH